MSFKSPYFDGYLFNPDFYSLKAYQTGLQVDAKVTYSVGPMIDATHIEEWKDPNKRSFMLGLLIGSTQYVEVEYRDTANQWFALDKEEDPGSGIPSDLATSVGTPPGKRWVGFKQPGAKDWYLDDSLLHFGLVQFDVRFKIYPTTGPEFVPFVGRHRQNKITATTFSSGSFGTGHMPSVWYVPEPAKKGADGKMFMVGPRGRVYLS